MDNTFQGTALAKNAFLSYNGDRRSILTHEHVVCGELRHAARTRLVVWAFVTLGTYAVSAPVSGTEDASTHFSFTQQYGHISRSCGLRFSGIRSVLLTTHQHFDSTSFRLRLRPRVRSQLLHATRTLKLNAVASELVEYRSTSAAERNDVGSTNMIDLCSPVPLGAI